MRLSLLLFLFAIPLCASPARGNYSLFDPSQAETLKPELRKFFGPQSGSFKYDKRMVRAAELAAERAYASTRYSCWRYVKEALLDAKIIDSYPKTRYAREAGTELQSSYGFKRLQLSDPYKAPEGAILVYGGPGAGHVEFRCKEGFVSDFLSPKPSSRPLIGIYVKPRS
jgi:hypothetical protein